MKHKTNSQNAAHHVIPLGNGWAVKSAESTTFILITDKRSEAITAARLLSKTKETDLVIHDKNGAVKDIYSYKKLLKVIED